MDIYFARPGLWLSNTLRDVAQWQSELVRPEAH